MLISDPETHYCKENYTIKCKQECCPKIEQYCIENNVFVEASCQHLWNDRRYYTHWKKQLNLLHDGIVLIVRFILVDLVYCYQLLMSFVGMSLSYVSRGLLWHLILYVTRHLIFASTFGENQKAQRQMSCLRGKRAMLQSTSWVLMTSKDLLFIGQWMHWMSCSILVQKKWTELWSKIY